MAAVRFEIKGMVGDHPVIVVEHVTRLREDLRPDWAQPAQPGGSYRVEITGEPSYVVDICPTSKKGDHNYAPESTPEPGFFYMPVQCHQCKNPPCVKVCPVNATWQEKDGITVIDYNWCIGCRYCEAACPYFARRFNFTEPSIPADKLNPNQSYLGNRPRHKGVMEKCHFCIQRTRAGRYPACLEVCPTGARKFGNILDPNSEVSYILKHKRVFVLKEEVGTLPRFFYYFDV